MNHQRYMDEIKLSAKKKKKNEKELKTSIQTQRIYSQDIGTEVGKENIAMLLMKK